MPQKIKMVSLRKAYNVFACPEWKETIESIVKNKYTFLDDDLVEIPDNVIALLMKRGTENMKEYAKKMGVDLAVDSNPFILPEDEQNRFSIANNLGSLSNKLFGDKSFFQIAYCSADNINRPDLKSRSFIVKNGYKVLTHICPAGRGTIIEFVKE